MYQVVPSNIKGIEKKKIVFENNMEKEFDAIVFATGYRSIANGWLKVQKFLLFIKTIDEINEPVLLLI